tara:strand:- start:34 stop:216 length:183 start_codon:yes stop_codon:yes gene_type:complete
MKIAGLLKGYITDALEFMPRNFPKPLAGMPEYLLTDTQVYPFKPTPILPSQQGCLNLTGH